MAELLTVGHGTATRQGLTSLLRGAEVGAVVDIRRFPGSRRDPDLASEELARWLPEGGIGYRWEPRLGGRRRLAAGTSSPDTWWRVEAFRAYAAYMRSEEFGEAMADLLVGLAGTRTAVMCSETLWWRCHRRLVSDAAELLHGVPVKHLMHDGALAPHRPSEGARVTAEGLVYDGRGTR
ncbi:MAG TPA: DUF488 domain-containing protein [Marmoricola sp.]|nr:DUF488 domain-containing protein [Marmoricola sp.]